MDRHDYRQRAEDLRRMAVRAIKRRAPGVMPPAECVLYGERCERAADAMDRAADDCYLEATERAVA